MDTYQHIEMRSILKYLSILEKDFRKYFTSKDFNLEYERSRST